jgi:hypothetical protein
MPNNVPEPLPAQCALDRKTLLGIENKLDKMSNQLDELTSMDGPISRMQQRLAIVENAADRAHVRIDNVAEQQKVDHDAITRWVAYAAVAAAIMTTGLNAFVVWLLP